MASAPQANLPLFYNDLMPLNSRDHANWTSRTLDGADFLKNQHAIPLTADEFVECQRSYPIVFTSGDNSLPIALMGLNEGVNTFVNDEGKISEPVYLPAYIRRYPFLLAKLQPDSEELSLCFDPSQEVLGEYEGGQPLFDDKGQPTEYTKGVLQFCENFEQSGQRTKAFMDELAAADILMDGEIAITQNDEPDKPFVYRGFRMVDEAKLRELPAAKLEEWNKNGLLMLIHAHLFSLNLMRIIFGRQVQQGTAPKRQEQAVN
ncbi:SapC family protein [Qipengyuania oceanensis]|uniref:Multidrug transporter n=1 Tax=Qipengyuania oceanensis TaxID=1463597 RepID=A0A844YE92_9SPHN|nr:SapC family protein [Qipengyuania oceanensis]MXO61963.1 multidrug transporter [Qipengyuania oceanensis]